MINDTDNTQNRGVTTEQIAAAGTWTDQEDVPQPAGHEGFDDGYADHADDLTAGPAAAAPADRGAPDVARNGNVATSPGPRASLLRTANCRASPCAGRTSRPSSWTSPNKQSRKPTRS